MSGYVNFLFEANICLVATYGAYWLLFRNENNFRFRRFFLVGVMFSAVVLPLISLDIASHELSSLSHISSSVLLPELLIGNHAAGEPGESATGWLDVMSAIYIAGGCILLFLFAFRLWKLHGFVKDSMPVSNDNGFSIRCSHHGISAMSFFRYIILGTNEDLTEGERDVMIRHEMVHGRQWHSADVFLMELLTIVLWFNPVAYLMRREISRVHEFLADRELSGEIDPEAYCNLLARVSLRNAGFSLVNHFHRFLTLERIKMINTMKRKISPWKGVALVPAAAALFIAIACHDHVMDDRAMADASAVVQNSSNAVNVPTEIQARFDAMQKAEPTEKFLLIELNEKGHAQLDDMEKRYGLPNFIQVFSEGQAVEEVTGTGEIRMKMDPKTNHTLHPGSRTFAIVRYNSHVESVLDQTASTNDVYTIVEETARPDGGMENYYADLMSKIKYPTAAKENGISGKVFVEFVVDKDGTLSDFEVKKGIGSGCDEAAINALASSAPWIPARHNGEVVRQKMVMPIVFAQNDQSQEILKNKILESKK